jgi:hypothetical protein
MSSTVMTVNLNQRGEVRSVSMTRATPDVDEPDMGISPSTGWTMWESRTASSCLT